MTQISNSHDHRIRPVNRLILVALLLSLTACAKKMPPVFFPADPAPPRIQLLTSFNNAGSLRGNELEKLLIGDDTADQLSKAFGLAFYDGQLYIADSGKENPGIAIVDFSTKKIKRFNEGITKPMTLALDSDGTLYVCDLSEGTAPAIVIYDNQQRFLRRMNLDIEGYRPAAVLVDGDRLYVADVMLNRIRVLDKHSGALLQTWGEDDKLGWPVDLSKTPEGNILVTEAGAQSLRLYSPEGKVLQRYGTPGDRSGNFSRPKATVVDRDGHIYAVDVAFQNVQIFDDQGQALMYFGHLPGNPNSLVMPAGIALTYDRMDIFQPYAAPGFTLEYVVAVSSQGAPTAPSKITLYGFGKAAGYDYTLPAESPKE